MQRRVSGGRRSRSASSCGRHLAVKISLSVSSDRQYLARVACMRFLSWVRILEKAILVRGRRRSARSSPGGIHTEGSVPLCSKRPSPSASSLSVLPKVPGTGMHVTHHEFRLRRVRQVGRTASSLDLIHDPRVPAAQCRQYQLPTVSRATGVPGGNWERKARMAPGSWSTRVRRTTLPRRSRTAKSEYLLCASQPTL